MTLKVRNPMKAWIWLALSLCVALLVTGCVSKAKHREDVKKAFLAGQSEATMRMYKSLGPSVTFEGEVRQPFVPWTRELTLAKAIIAAEYCGAQDPREVTIIRNGENLTVDLDRFLAGEDYPVAPGDVIRIK